MDFGKLLKQKTTWAGAALIVAGIGQIVAEQSQGEGIRTIFEGLSLIFLRQAVAKMV